MKPHLPQSARPQWPGQGVVARDWPRGCPQCASAPASCGRGFERAEGLQLGRPPQVFVEHLLCPRQRAQR